MVDNDEMTALVETARSYGIVLRTTHHSGTDWISEVMIRGGHESLKVGPHWMPVVAAAERLREFVLAQPDGPQRLESQRGLNPRKSWQQAIWDGEVIS